jgi:tRNA modification GTPase
LSLTATAAPHPDDTIVAVSSAPGPRERAIVRVGGQDARRVIDSVFESQTAVGIPRHLVNGFVRLSGVHSPLPATLYYFHGPRSYTGQDLAELHTIGSPPLIERLVADLLNAGARPAQPGEFTLRAFLAGKKDLPQAEAVNAVVAAGTDSDLTLALAQLAGGVTRPLAALRDDLLNLLADLEASLDFADEDIQFVGKSETLTRLDIAIDRIAELELQLDNRSVSGRPIRAALVGLPNAGKSSLFNALAGGDALVSTVPGTTRDYLTRRLTVGGAEVELIDTAGWDNGTDTIDRQAQSLGGAAAAGADLILWCDERGDFSQVDSARLAATGAEVIRVRTKADLSGRTPTVIEGVSEGVASSVLSPAGTEHLRLALADRVAALVRPALAPSQSRCRHHVAASADHLRAARDHVAAEAPPELAAAELRAALGQLGEMTGAVYTNDLLDRIFSRFCIGK